ncbi:scoloptoxin SSD558-like [Uranotaenia lowii]|uniref:scoloptoxin SSD558-like n=1 Tax=Uranotaenia lowii TaxID=190385 RepID=UPI002479C75C|nr:scoloptoxin SSD558-like [Uranotaenia lowii]
MGDGIFVIVIVWEFCAALVVALAVIVNNHTKDATYVACNADPGFGDLSGKTIPIDSAKQSLIVNLHNEFRNKIANGKQEFPGGFYPEAARMATIQWDDELAFIAATNARKCKFGHDECQNTPKYPASGQNLGSFAYTGGFYDVDEIIKNLTNGWYSEFKRANPQFIKEFTNDYKGVNHLINTIFLDKPSDTSLKLWLIVRTTKIYLMCNYARTNIVTRAAYTSGKVASPCKTGTNKKFPGLCSSRESRNYSKFDVKA